MKTAPSLVPALIAVALTSCAWMKHDAKDKDDKNRPKIEPPQLVGRVASIPPDKKFVLIQSYGPWKAESGSILTTRGPENRAANLLVTGEKLGDFAAADLQSGTVEIGDGVYTHHVPKPPETPETPAAPESSAQASDPQKKDHPENVQKNN